MSGPRGHMQTTLPMLGEGISQKPRKYFAHKVLMTTWFWRGFDEKPRSYT